jgi:hypothetical protein
MGAVLYLFVGLLAVLGRIVGQMLGVRWNERNSRRDLRMSALVDAWRRLARVTSLPSADFQQALADIQLVGTPAQVELATSAMRPPNELAGEASVHELLEALRVELRAEMGLDCARTPLAFPLIGVDRRHAHDGGLARSASERRQIAHDLRRGQRSARLTGRGQTASMRIAQGQA